MGVQIEMAYYYVILSDGVRTIQDGGLIEEGALTEVLRYSPLIDFRKIICLIFVLQNLLKTSLCVNKLMTANYSRLC